MTITIKRKKAAIAVTRTGRQRTIRVRMYNVGFGDCFLLRVPTELGERRVLVDCGYHSQGKGAFSDDELVQQIIHDLDGQGLDVVVATHRHQDHISGFGEVALWKDIGVEEVWLPFTASPDASKDDPSLAAWERLIAAVPRLVNASGALTPLALGALGARSADEQGEAAFMLWNARANEPGIENLTKGLTRANGTRSVRRYLPASGKDVPFSFETPALPGVKVHVLGPSRDPKFRGKRTAPSSWGVTEEALNGDGAASGSPFGPEWRIPDERLPGRRPFLEKSLHAIAQFNTDLLAAAKAVEGFLNGESLVLVLEVGAARLLLPGDAEVGSWMKMVGTPDALELAAGATFLKVGHHGSHNATPLFFVKEHLAANTPAVLSTQEGPGRFRTGIPLPALLSVLAERRMPFARSDVGLAEATGVFTPGPDGKWIDVALPC